METQKTGFYYSQEDPLKGLQEAELEEVAQTLEKLEDRRVIIYSGTEVYIIDPADQEGQKVLGELKEFTVKNRELVTETLTHEIAA